jgi:hypothetical protein
MEYDIQQGGLGYGGYATAGLRFKVNDTFSLETSAVYYNKKINLQGYSTLKSNFSALIKLCFSVLNEETAP